MILMFIGKTSSGKDFFYNRTIDKYNLEKIVLATTRPKRIDEVDGENYFFMDKEKLDKLDFENKLVERRDYNTVHGVWSYATVGTNIDKDKNYLVINTWEGYEKYINYFGRCEVIPFYFELDTNTRFERAYERENKQKNKRYLEMCRRFMADEEDFSNLWIEKYSPVIIDNNTTIENTDRQIDKHIKRLIK